MNFFDKFKKQNQGERVTPIVFIIEATEGVSAFDFELTKEAISSVLGKIAFYNLNLPQNESVKVATFIFNSEASWVTDGFTSPTAAKLPLIAPKSAPNYSLLINELNKALSFKGFLNKSVDCADPIICFFAPESAKQAYSDILTQLSANDLIARAKKAIFYIQGEGEDKLFENEANATCYTANPYKLEQNVFKFLEDSGIALFVAPAPSASFSISQNDDGYFVPSYSASPPVSSFCSCDTAPQGFSDFDSDEACSTLVIEGDDGRDFDYSDASREILIPPIAQQVTPTPTATPKFCYACGNQLQPNSRFCAMCGTQIPTITPSLAGTRPSMEGASKPLELSTVQFSALAPKEFIKGRYTMVNITLYEEEYRAVVDQIIQSAESEVREVVGSPQMLEAKTSVTVILSSPDVEVTDCEETQVWLGKFLNFDFPISVPSDFAKSQILFVATVYFNNVIATKLKFIAKARSVKDQKMSLLREDVLSAFVSYARQDIDLVTATIQGMRKARPEMEIFLDIDMLRSGEKWENVLKTEIEQRDILYLFWSSNAKQSEWVDKEWRYALDNKGIDCIEPIPLDTPEKCPPPSELNALHFNDRYLLYRNKENRSSDGI